MKPGILDSIWNKNNNALSVVLARSRPCQCFYVKADLCHLVPYYAVGSLSTPCEDHESNSAYGQPCHFSDAYAVRSRQSVTDKWEWSLCYSGDTGRVGTLCQEHPKREWEKTQNLSFGLVCWNCLARNLDASTVASVILTHRSAEDTGPMP